MPTASVMPSSVMLFSVKSIARISVNGDDDRGRNRQPRDDHGADVADEEHHDERGEEAAQDQVLLERGDRRVDELRVVAGDRQRDLLRQRALRSSQLALTPSTTAIVFSPVARRTSSITAGFVVQPHRRGRPLGGVLGVADVGDADRRAVHRRDDDVVELLGGVDASQRPQQDLRPCPARRCRPASRRSRRRSASRTCSIVSP